MEVWQKGLANYSIQIFKVDPEAKFRPLTQIDNISSLVALGKNRLVRLYISLILYILLYIDIISVIIVN